MSVSDFSEITRTEPEKSLLVPYRKSGGRNNQGRRSARYIGGGHKRRYRLIDFREISMAYLLGLLRLSMIRIVLLGLLCCIMRTGRSAIS